MRDNVMQEEGFVQRTKQAAMQGALYLRVGVSSSCPLCTLGRWHGGGPLCTHAQLLCWKDGSAGIHA